MEKLEFNYAFQLSRKRIFEVTYCTLRGNSRPFFSTCASLFNQPKTDWERCGQCQKDICRGEAYKFYKKWNHLHLKDLTDEEYEEIRKDIEVLKDKYNYIEKFAESEISNIRFSEIKKLSMQKVKKEQNEEYQIAME